MKHVELTCELIASIARGGPLNKKKALDEVIGGQSIHKGNQAHEECKRIRSHRQPCRENVPPTPRDSLRQRSRLLQSILARLGLGPKRLCPKERHSQPSSGKAPTLALARCRSGSAAKRRAVGASPDQRIFADYLMTIQGDTDSQATRERRSQILHSLLAGIFEKKDERRVFP